MLVLATAVSAQGDPGEDPSDPGDSDSGGAGHGSVSVGLGFYDHDDGGGNPFLDEDLTVIEPVVVFDYNLTDRLTLISTLSFDWVSSASIDRLSKFPEQSGASGDYYIGADFGLDYRASDTLSYGGHLGFSVEYDYLSIGFGGHTKLTSDDQNSIVNLNLNGFWDSIDVIRFDGTQNETDERLSVAATASWYRALSENLHSEIGATLAFQSGFLETPYNAVVIEDPSFPANPNLDNLAQGIEITEELPDDRVRAALFGKVRRWMRPGTALELGGRLYGDSWDVMSFAVEPRLYQDISDDWLMRLRYRYYSQTEAKYFDDQFLLPDQNEEFRTQDSDLADFDSHSVGALFRWNAGETYGFEFGADYVLRSDDIDQILVRFGWNWKF